MPRHTRATALETRSGRSRLAQRKKPYFTSIGFGVALGYRRLQNAGSWTVRASNGAGARWTKVFAVADDNEDANGNSVLNFWQAQDKARSIARADRDTGGDRPITVPEALANYEAELTARGGDSQNVSRVRHHLSAALGTATVGLLNARELRQWRDGLIKKGLAPASAGRTARVLKAALTLAAREDHRITNTAAWRDGLRSLPDAEGGARNVILSDDEVRKVVAAAYELNPGFGLWIEVLATCGCRSSQAARLQVSDLQTGAAPRLMMPSSKKGRRRRIERQPVPIPASLARSLRLAAGDRAPHEPLLKVPGCRRTHFEWFRRAAVAAGLDPKVSVYALRHSSIVRMLISGTPIRITAVHHNTSAQMIERSYSRHINDHADTVVRRGLIDIAAPAGTNIVPLVRP
jgi:integrase